MNTDILVKVLNIPGVGRVKALKIIEEYKDELNKDEDLFHILPEAQKKLKLKKMDEEVMKQSIEQAEIIKDQSLKRGIKIISVFDEIYPDSLKTMKDFPLILNYKGDIKALLDHPAVAVVGSRESTPFGYKLSRRLGELLAQQSINVVSGLALGCDAAAHEGALFGNGATTAVMAHGLDQIFPKENKNLAERILSNGGCLLSEYFINQKPQKNFYVSRNRIQAGLSQGVIVVESRAESGTMHTARFTQEYDRLLGCINYPEKYKSAQSKGNSVLLKGGYAKPLYSESEIRRYMEAVGAAYHNQLVNQEHEDGNRQLSFF